VIAFTQAFRTPDLRKKLLFTLGIIVLFRFGSVLPAPGISEPDVRHCSGLASAQGAAASVYAVLNLFSGNSLLHVTVFAVGIMPYITASIIVQLLTQVIPRLQTLKDEGRAGQAKITQYTRYLTVMLAVVVSAGYVELARSGSLFPGTDCSAVSYPLIPRPSVITIATMMVTMVAGTAVIMWMGELVTDRGVGNGMSVLVLTSVIAVIPGQLEQIDLTRGVRLALAAAVVIVAVIGFVVFMEQAQRRIPVQYAKRMTGRRVYGGTSTYIPVKVNQAGVVPVIFASSMLTIPQLAVSLLGRQDRPQAWVAWVDRYLSPDAAVVQVYFLTFFLLILAFTYFYARITFNPQEVADNIKRYGGFVPGLRPGTPTAEHLGYVLARLTAAGSVYLAVIALLPLVALHEIGLGGQALLSGVSLLIVVGVGLDTVKQIESQLQQHSYEGFLRSAQKRMAQKNNGPEKNLAGTPGSSAALTVCETGARRAGGRVGGP
jgi:preprotein translocase subunit SecY